MPMDPNETADPDAPDLWTVKPDRLTKYKWQLIMDDYLVAFDKEPEQVEFSVDLVKECLRFLKKHDERWKGTKLEEFNTYLYPAHAAVYQGVRNRLDSVLAEK